MHISSEEALILTLYSLDYIFFFKTFSTTLKVADIKAFKLYNMYPKILVYQVILARNADCIPVRGL